MSQRLNIEIKARCFNPARICKLLEAKNADFRGVDHQVDTYFRVPGGRLKLRQGNIETALIHYRRDNQAGPKRSEVLLYHPVETPDLKAILKKALGILTVVDKYRHIYFIDNVKFHVDEVKGLGAFCEIEVINKNGSMEEAEMHKQCARYLDYLNIEEDDLIEVSYSDLIINGAEK